MLLNAPLIDIIKLLLSTLLMPLFFNIKKHLTYPCDTKSHWFKFTDK